MTRTVLVVDDEASIRRVLAQYLEAEGHRVLQSGTGAQALAALGIEGPENQIPVDLVLLDIGLPDIDGLEVLARLRRTSSTYVMLVSARAEETDKLVGLNVGADDYVTKPFSVREIAARIKAVFRRLDNEAKNSSQAPSDDVVRTGGLVINPATREVTVDGQPVDLTTLDFDLLHALAATPGRVWSRPQLLEQVWGYDFYGDDRVVDVHIRAIRKALGDVAVEPRFIVTVRGIGYKLVAQS